MYIKRQFTIINSKGEPVLASEAEYLEHMDTKTRNYDQGRRERLMYVPAPSRSYSSYLEEDKLKNKIKTKTQKYVKTRFTYKRWNNNTLFH